MVDAFDTWYQALSLSGMPGKVYRSVGQVCRLMPEIILHIWDYPLILQPAELKKDRAASPSEATPEIEGRR